MRDPNLTSREHLYSALAAWAGTQDVTGQVDTFSVAFPPSSATIPRWTRSGCTSSREASWKGSWPPTPPPGPGSRPAVMTPSPSCATPRRGAAAVPPGPGPAGLVQRLAAAV